MVRLSTIGALLICAQIAVSTSAFGARSCRDIFRFLGHNGNASAVVVRYFDVWHQTTRVMWTSEEFLNTLAARARDTAANGHVTSSVVLVLERDGAHFVYFSGTKEEINKLIANLRNANIIDGNNRMVVNGITYEVRNPILRFNEVTGRPVITIANPDVARLTSTVADLQARVTLVSDNLDGLLGQIVAHADFPLTGANREQFFDLLRAGQNVPIPNEWPNSLKALVGQARSAGRSLGTARAGLETAQGTLATLPPRISQSVAPNCAENALIGDMVGTAWDSIAGGHGMTQFDQAFGTSPTQRLAIMSLDADIARRFGLTPPFVQPCTACNNYVPAGLQRVQNMRAAAANP